MNAIKVLQNDHHVIGELFNAYHALPDDKEEVARKLIVELSVQASLEETILFRLARERGVAMQQLAQRGTDIHNVIATTLRDLEKLLAKPADSVDHEARLDAIVKTLLEETRRHIQEDINWMIPALKREFNSTELESIGTLMVYSRPTARRHPHPNTPAHPPAVIQLGDGAPTPPSPRTAVHAPAVIELGDDSASA